MVQAMLADMDAATEAARQLLYTACEEIEAGRRDAARWAAICKLVGRRHGDAGHAPTRCRCSAATATSTSTRSSG